MLYRFAFCAWLFLFVVLLVWICVLTMVAVQL